MSDFTQRHAASIGFFGLFLLLMAGGYYLVVRQFDLPMRGLLGVGAALVVFALMENPRGVIAAFGGRRLLYGSNTVLMIALAIAILGGLNFIANKESKRWDLTEAKEFTLSEQTLSVIERVNQPLKVKAFFRSDDPGRGQAQDLLKEYTSRNKLIETEFIDPEMNPGAVEQYNVRYAGTVVFLLGDKRQEATGPTESNFTAAMVKLLSNRQRTVYFITGHEERSPTDFNRPGYGTLKKALEDDSIKVDEVTLATTGKVPDDASAVILASPRKALLAEETDALRNYLWNGGSAMILRDPRTGTDLNDLLREWGVEFNDGIIVDPVASYMNDRISLIANRYLYSPITDKMRAISLFPLAGQVTALTETQGMKIMPLVQSSDQSWLEFGEDFNFDEGKDVKGPIEFAATVESPELSAAVPTPASGQQTDQTATARKARLMLVADADFVSNAVIEEDRVPGNRDFFVNGVNWLTRDDDEITIRPRETEQRFVLLTPTQMNLVFFGSVLFVPGLVLAGGAYVWWRRR